jgi:signal transduction histidine kinase
MLLVLTCFIPAVVVPLGLLYFDYRQDLQYLRADTLSTSRALSSALDQHVIGVQAVLSTLANSEQLNALDAANLPAFDKLARTARINGRQATVVLSDTSNLPLIHTGVPWGAALPLKPPQNMLEAKSRHPLVSALFIAPVLKKKLISVSMPVLRDGQTIYRISAPIALDQLRDLLLEQKLSPNWIAAVVDANGVIIARTHDHEKSIGAKVQPALFKRIQQVQQDNVESVTVDGVPVFTAFNRSSLSGLTVVIGMPRAELDAELKHSLWLLLASTALLLAASLALAWRFAERITQTIYDLRDQALALGRGEKPESSRANFREAQQLAQAFGQAADQLSQTHEALVQRNLDLQQFAFVASHDLRSPLRSVKGYLTLLQARHASGLSAKGQDLIERATAALGQMNQLTEDLLSYARLDAPAQPPAPVDCREVLAQSLSLLDATIAETGAQITVEDLPTVIGQRGQLTELFQNLVGNAMKYCRGDAPRIRVSAQRGAAEWIFEVADNGIGIEPQHLTRIFEVFKRLHTAQEYEGNGIGLAICQRIVVRHGGRIWVQSEPGQGSRFYFSIPDLKAGTS